MAELPSAAARQTDCTIRYEGADVPAVAGEPVAVALAAAGHRVLSRSIKYHRPRSFFCLAGHCNGCLMRIDGVPNVKACRAPAREGLAVERQNAFPSGSFDVLGAADWFFPRGMDHHTLMTSSTALNAIMQKVVREIGGLGVLPEQAPGPEAFPPAPAAGLESVDVAIVGGGPAGLAAAIACRRARPAARVALYDEGDQPGGSLWSDPDGGPARARALGAEAIGLGVELWSRAAAFAWYPEDSGGVLAVDRAGALVRVRARRYLYATGGYDVNALFGDNDRPGICAGRAVGTLLLRHGVLPAERPLVLGSGAYAEALAAALAATGAPVERVDNRDERAVLARGTSWVSGLEVERAGRRRKIACDLVAVVEPPAPASELPRMHGAAVAMSPGGGGFAAIADAHGQTGVDGVYAAGDVCGYAGVAAALARGAHVGRALAASLPDPAAARGG